MKIILETKRLILREFEPQDLADLSEILQDKEVMYAWEHAFSDAEVMEWYNRQIDRYHTCGYGYWAVIEKSSNQFIGQCGILMTKIEGKEFPEIGYLFKKKYWCNGFATEAATGCKNYAFEALQISKIYSTVRTNNIASQKVAEKIGMKIEKEIIKHYNTDMPHYLYSIEK